LFYKLLSHSNWERDRAEKIMPIENPNAYVEILFRLGLALLAGVILGLNRWMHHKSAGIRTHSLVALGAALVMLLVGSFPGADAQASSRVLQGLITGIGFLGAGVIIHQDHSQTIHGLTTAASVWACAILGATFGSGFYVLGICATSAILFILIVGGPIERLVKICLGIRRESEISDDSNDHSDVAGPKH
jgi:putative Mg2+ transporter-C (MgtC) family protein